MTIFLHCHFERSKSARWRTLLRSRETCCLLAKGVILVLAILAVPLIASAQWNESVLYSFQGGTDGQWPVGQVVFDAAGNLYGATMGGGSTNCHSYQQCGTVYQLSPPLQPGDAWTETVLHVFQGNADGDGSSPYGGLAIDEAGNLYGTTATGGTGNCFVLGILMGCGTVYEVSPPAQQGDSWTEQVLYSFQSGADANTPTGDLVFDKAGNLYGASLYGGGHGTNCGDPYFTNCGAVFELSPPGGAWTEQVLHGFRGLPAPSASITFGDGANPNGGLAIDNTGAIYGTTQIGGFACAYNKPLGCGSVFKLAPPAKQGQPWIETILHRFDPGTQDGAVPLGGVTLGPRGILFGTASQSGPKFGGIVFSLSSPMGNSSFWQEAIVYGFSGRVNGYHPEGSLKTYAGNSACGTTYSGTGDAFQGSVYCLDLSGGQWTLDELHGFAGLPDGEGPTAGVTLGSFGNLYGTTENGGTGTSCTFNCGTVFEISPTKEFQ